MGGGGKPATMYTFGQSATRGAPQAAPATPVTIYYLGVRIGSQSAGDRILTETGNQVAYIAEARWVAPASELFDAAAISKLENIGPSMQVTRTARPKAKYMLGVDVQRFSAVYTGAQGSPPEAVVQARAKLVRIADRTIVGDWPIEERVPASENRVTAIVAALDRGTDAATTQIANLTRQAASADAAN
jgi:cholesterol transport system auxiliary component